MQVYVDHSAGKPVDSRVIEVMNPYFKTLYGVGFDIYHKHKATDGSYADFYLAYGVSYSYFYLDFHEEVWQTRTDGSLDKIYRSVVKFEF